MKRTVYDKDGNAFEIEAIDAREWVATGNYANEPPAAPPEAEQPAQTDPPKPPESSQEPDPAPPAKPRKG